MSIARQRRNLAAGVLIYAAIVLSCFSYLLAGDQLSLGRNPVRNFFRTAAEMSHPSFLDVWFGDEDFKYRSDSGEILRRENRREMENNFLSAIGRALWVTFAIATLGTALGSVLSLPLALGIASNLKKPVIVAYTCKLILDSSRSIHTLVFGLMFVGIVGLGPTAGILAIAAHSLGSFGKLYAESIETMNMAPVRAIQGVGATPMQVLSFGILPEILPQFISTYLYIWEFNTRDSTVLGLIGAGGLGLLISEAISLFQWSRLGTLIIAIVAFVLLFDFVSRKVRRNLV